MEDHGDVRSQACVGSPGVLDKTELKRRLEAARTLRGLRQVDLAEMLIRDGFGKHDVGRLERGQLDLQRKWIDALCRHLRVPERWLTDPDLDAVLGYTEEEEPSDSEGAAAGVTDDQLRRAAELLAPELLRAARELQRDEAKGRRPSDARDRQGGGAGAAGA